ncbi:hypothetical protein CHS0354_012807 [Potamilus streckersoni]|uniref:Uncharacterized protein n=1 Tax=Potamilus streckersoni TaxID=2493646 RepID=A0AAE0SW73_9BIVA|nr:hypothetical protein CHS0354_012807 [Potamilus streckersoni]
MMSTMNRNQRLSPEECDTELYLTPIAVERPMAIPTSEEGDVNYSYAMENMQFGSFVQLLHENQSLFMNEYENVDASSNEDIPQLLHEENMIYEIPVYINTPFHHTPGYLTVLSVSETAV